MNTQQIIKRRHVATIIVRGLALAMMLYGGVYVLWGLGTFLGINGLVNVFQGFSTFWTDMFNPFWYGLAVLLPGILIAVLDRRIVRWLIPVPRHECPQCGYALRQLGSNRCPECGCELVATKESTKN